MVRVNSDNLFGTTQYIVDANASLGSFTTIQAAVTAANAAGGGNVFIRAGTFTENVNVPSNVTLTGYTGETFNATSSQTTILGSLVFTDVTNVSLYNLYIKANGATVPLQFLGTNPLEVNITNITVQAAAGATILFTNTGTNSSVFINQSFLYQDGAFPVFSMSSGFIDVSFSFIGPSVQPNIIVPSPISGTGVLTIQESIMQCSVVLTGTAQMLGIFSQIGGLGIAIDNQATKSSSFDYCLLESGDAHAAINVNAGGAVFLVQTSIFSTAATHAVTGAGSFEYDVLSFTSGSNTTLDPALSVTVETVRPFATTSIRGLASFNPADFTVNAAGQVSSISAPTITWVTTSTNVANMSVATGYFCISPGGALTLGLPSTSALGDTIRVSLAGATSWQITQAAGQQIRLSSSTTTLGATGSLTSTAQGDSIELVCLTANTIWVAQDVIGNLTIS
jgi:hypothetical protein